MPKKESFRKLRKTWTARKRVHPNIDCGSLKVNLPVAKGFGYAPKRQRSRCLDRLRVTTLAGERFRGRLLAGTQVIPCVIGPGGMTRGKREGDGASPVGCYRLVRLLYRPDRGVTPQSGLPRRAIRPKDGWCDDPTSPSYNQPITLPSRLRHERMWRDDRLYDLVVILDYNLWPARKGRGSAIFLHVRFSADKPTAGCVAIEPDVLRRLLPRLGPHTRIQIG